MELVSAVVAGRRVLADWQRNSGVFVFDVEVVERGPASAGAGLAGNLDSRQAGECWPLPSTFIDEVERGSRVGDSAAVVAVLALEPPPIQLEGTEV